MKFLFIILSIFIFKISSAASNAQQKYFDTTIIRSSRDYKLNEDDFLKTYGNDDSSKALIKYFFYKRSASKKMIYIPLIVDAAITPLVFVFANTKKDNPTVRDDYPGLLLIFLAFFATTATIALAINGSVRLLIFSKKKLLHHLDNYIAGKPIPKRITKTKIFVAFLHGAKTIKRHPFTRQ